MGCWAFGNSVLWGELVCGKYTRFRLFVKGMGLGLGMNG